MGLGLMAGIIGYHAFDLYTDGWGGLFEMVGNLSTA